MPEWVGAPNAGAAPRTSTQPTTAAPATICAPSARKPASCARRAGHSDPRSDDTIGLAAAYRCKGRGDAIALALDGHEPAAVVKYAAASQLLDESRPGEEALVHRVCR